MNGKGKEGKEEEKEGRQGEGRGVAPSQSGSLDPPVLHVRPVPKVVSGVAELLQAAVCSID